MKRHIKRLRVVRGGFTMVELLVAASLGVMVVGGALAIYVSVIRYWKEIQLRIDADHEVNIAMSRLVYGVNNRAGLRAASDVTLSTSGGGWTLTYFTGSVPPQTNSFTYTSATSNLVFNPGSILAGESISYAKIVTQANALNVTLRVDRIMGKVNARREIGTKISWRN